MTFISLKVLFCPLSLFVLSLCYIVETFTLVRVNVEASIYVPGYDES